MLHLDDFLTWPWAIVLWAVHLLLFILVMAHCLQRRRESTSALLWLFIAWSIPLFGAIIYLVFGVDRVIDKGFQKHRADQRLLTARKATLSRHSGVIELADPFSRDINRAMDSMFPEHPLMAGNDIVPLLDGDEAFPKMLEAISKAERNINLMTFIIDDDVVGRKFLDALAERARSGVTVRLIYDRFGSTFALWRGLFRRYKHTRNMHIVGWTQANPWKRQIQVNLRNHRKILVVDGRHAFIGGINLHVEHTTRDGRPPIRDYHFSVRGPIVHDLQYTFMRDWFFMTDENPSDLLNAENFPVLDSVGSHAVRVVNGGPASEMEAIADVIFMAIVAARRQVLAVTPYFVPHRDLVGAMRAAALRGVDIRLVVPKINNHLAAGFASKALYEDLLNAGVRIYERRPPFMHAKALVVDDAFAFIGTSNLDVRSFRLDYETNLAICDSGFAGRLKQLVLDDIAQSHEVKKAVWARRSQRERVLENLCSLLVPVL